MNVKKKLAPAIRALIKAGKTEEARRLVKAITADDVAHQCMDAIISTIKRHHLKYPWHSKQTGQVFKSILLLLQETVPDAEEETAS